MIFINFELKLLIAIVLYFFGGSYALKHNLISIDKEIVIQIMKEKTYHPTFFIFKYTSNTLSKASQKSSNSKYRFWNLSTWLMISSTFSCWSYNSKCLKVSYMAILNLSIDIRSSPSVLIDLNVKIAMALDLARSLRYYYIMGLVERWERFCF